MLKFAWRFVVIVTVVVRRLREEAVGNRASIIAEQVKSWT
jgi:hypothetical protein